MDVVRQIIDQLSSWLAAPFGQWLGQVEGARIAIGLGLIVIVVLLRKVLARAAIKVGVYIANAIGIRVSDDVQKAVGRTAQALIVSLACLIALDIVQLPEAVANFSEKILVSVAIAAIFAAIYTMSDTITGLLDPYRTSRTAVQLNWIVKLAKTATVFLAVASILKVWGIDIGLVLTGMGVLGAAVALAAQDLLKNLIAGVTNIGEKRFGVGEWIRVEGIVEGTVESIDLRSTLVRRFDLAPVYVPNAELADTAVTNFSRMPYRRIYWKISLLYATTTDQLREVRNGIDRYIDRSDDFVGPPKASRHVYVDSFGESSIDVLVYCFTASPALADYLAAKERLALGIREIVAAAGSGFAYPSRSIYIEASSESDAGTFIRESISQGSPTTLASGSRNSSDTG